MVFQGDALKKALRERETLNGKGPLNAVRKKKKFVLVFFDSDLFQVYEAAKACNEQNEYADCKEKMLPGVRRFSPSYLGF